jgi:hypothetical protein
MAGSDPIKLETPVEEERPLTEEELRPLRERCKAAGIPLTLIPPEDAGFDEEMYAIDFPAGREIRRFYIYDREALELVLALPFEKFSFLADHEAIISRADRKVCWNSQ